jgi:hypothetical protein
MDGPPQTNRVIGLLPDPLDFNVQVLEKEGSVEPQAPEYQFVIVYALESISGVAKHNIISVY